MSTTAYVLIQTENGKAKEVNGLLRRFKEIVSADLVANPYDIIALVAGKTQAQLEDFVSRKLYSVNGITRTVFCEVVPLGLQDSRGSVRAVTLGNADSGGTCLIPVCLRHSEEGDSGGSDHLARLSLS